MSVQGISALIIAITGLITAIAALVHSIRSSRKP